MLAQSNGTPLWESALDALGMLSDRIGTGGVIVLLTDGEANSSTNLQNVLDTADAQSVQIFTIGLGSSVDFQQLRDVANATGGAFAEASDPSAMAAAFAGVGTGARAGFVTVNGTVTYTAQAAGDYTLAGTLKTSIGGVVIDTPFTMTVTIAP